MVIYLRSVRLIFLFLGGLICMTGCGSDSIKNDKKTNPLVEAYYDGIGVGPVSTPVTLNTTIDIVKAADGEELFNSKCLSCHSADETRKIGPGLKGVTKRRRPEWILNQILNPLEMAEKDSLAKELLSIYMAQMIIMDVSQEEAYSLLEFLRRNDQ